MIMSGFLAIASHFRTRARQAVGFAFVLSALNTPALATPSPSAPEIDPGSLLSGLTLLCCGMAILTHRTRR